MPPDTFGKQHRFLLGALFLGHLSNDWVAGTLWLLAPAIAVSMGLGPTEVGLILTINGIGAGLAYIPAGVLSDRSTRPGWLMLLSFWWVAVGYLSATLVPGFWAITLLLALGVMGDAFWHPVATGVLVKKMPERRAQALGIHAVGGSIGTAEHRLSARILQLADHAADTGAAGRDHGDTVHSDRAAHQP